MKKIIFFLTSLSACVFVGSVFAISFENPTPMFPINAPAGVAVKRSKNICTNIADLWIAYNGRGWEGALNGTKLPKGWEILEAEDAGFVFETDQGRCPIATSFSDIETCCEQYLGLTYRRSDPRQDRAYILTADGVRVCKLKSNGEEVLLGMGIQREGEPRPVMPLDCESITTKSETGYFQCADHVVGITTNGTSCSETYQGFSSRTATKEFVESLDPASVPHVSISVSDPFDISQVCPPYAATIGKPYAPSAVDATIIFHGSAFAEYSGDAASACQQLGYTYVTASDVVNRALWSDDGLYFFGRTFSQVMLSSILAGLALLAAVMIVIIKKGRV